MKKTVVTIITADKLSASQKKVVMAELEQKLGSVQLEEVVDPSVMGGLRIKLGDQDFDATLSGKLERLETQVPVVTVTTAIELTDAQRKQITAAVETRLGAVTINEVIDPSIIGGIKIIAGSKELDASVKGRLEKLKLQLIQTL